MSDSLLPTMNAGPPRKRFPMPLYLVGLLVIAAIALAPLASVALAGWIASSHECQLDEGSVHPCIVAGADRGELLYTLGVLGWLMLVTLPLGAIAGVIWLVALAVHRLGWNKRQKSTRAA